MAKVKLREIATLITKGTTPTTLGFDFVDEGINFVKIESITDDGYFIHDKFAHITDDCNQKLFRSQLQENDLLFSIAGAIGRTAIVKEEILPANTNQALAIIRVPSGIIDYSYLKYVLQSPTIAKQFEKRKQGVAQLNISLKDIGDFEIPMRKKEEQREILAVFDKVNSLIAMRKEQLAKLDELFKARFVEMFGDPVLNPKGWTTVPFLDMGECKNGMNFHSDDAGVEIHCLGVGDFKERSAIRDVSALPKVSLNAMPTQDYLLQNDDIVFVRSNGNKALVGRCLAVYPNDIPTTFSGFCIRYRRNSDSICTDYLLRVLKSDSIRKKMAGRGANIQNLNQQILASLSIPVPPLEIQKQFSEFVEQTNKTKLTIQASLDKLEVMKKALMQEYFG